MAKFATQEWGVMRAAVLTETGDTYSEGLSTAFNEHFTAGGGTIAVHRFYDTGATDFTEQLPRLSRRLMSFSLPAWAPNFRLPSSRRNQPISVFVQSSSAAMAGIVRT